jgi:hypothetical protein
LPILFGSIFETEPRTFRHAGNLRKPIVVKQEPEGMKRIQNNSVRRIIQQIAR